MMKLASLSPARQMASGLFACAIALLFLPMPLASGMTTQASRETIFATIPSDKAMTLKGKAFYPEGEHQWFLTVSSDGRARSEISGLLSIVTVYDGTHLWRRENGATPYRIDFAEKEVWLMRNYLLAGLETRLSLPSNSPDDLQVEAGLLHFTQSRTDTGQIKFVAENSPNKEGITFGGPDLAPGTTIMIENIGNASGYQIDTIDITNAPPATLFEKPENTNPDFRYLSNIAPEIAVRQTSSGHLFVRPTLNGKDHGWFLFDSGAGFSGLAGKIAEAEGFERVGEIEQAGLGGKSRAAGIFKGGPLQLGPLVIDNLFFHDVGDMKRASKMLGKPVAGVLGWDILTRAIAEVDMQEGRVFIHDPRAFQIEPENLVRLYLHWQVPYAIGRGPQDLTGAFMIDTGAGSRGLLFPYYSVVRFGLLKGREGAAETIEGAGGKVAMLAGQLEWFEIGGYTTRPVPASFSLEEDYEGDLFSVGILGGAVVQPFRIVLDYSRSQVGFVPRQ